VEKAPYNDREKSDADADAGTDTDAEVRQVGRSGAQRSKPLWEWHGDPGVS
jgi:hypothetical protein